jgi:branched-chain amino acid transport system permease protein
MLYRETGQFKTTYASDMQMFPIRQDRIALGVLLAVAFLVVPVLGVYKVGIFAGDYIFKAILIPFLILSLAAIGLNILTGYCGQISLGGAAFMAIGAYSAFKLNTGVKIGTEAFTFLDLPALSTLPSILLGGIMAALVGVLFGVPSLRIKGLYLAVATLAAQFFFDWVFARVKWFTNYEPSGSVSAPQMNILGWTVDTAVDRYMLALVFVGVFALIAKNLVRGSIGRQWMAIRDMDIAAEIMGVRPLYAKLTAFAVSSFFCGIAGALWAFVHLGSWEPLAFDINRSNQLLFMIIIGGLGSILGSFLGAGFILLFPILLEAGPARLGVPLSTETITHLQFMIFGGLICYLLIKEPHGFAKLWALAKEKLRLWPFPY